MENENEGIKEGEKTENFPKSLFVHYPWPVIRDIIERRFSEMWSDATPVDIDNVSSVSNGETKKG